MEKARSLENAAKRLAAAQKQKEAEGEAGGEEAAKEAPGEQDEAAPADKEE